MHYYPFHVGDYQAHTAHLTNTEDLAYRRMLDLYYLTEKPFPDDPLWIARRIRMGSDPDIVQALLVEFFEKTDEGWRSKRCDKELSSFQAMKQGGRKGAAKRWAKPGHSHPNAHPIDTLIATNNQEPEPITKNQEPKKSPKGLYIFKPPQVDDDVWQAFQAIRKAKRSPITQIALDGIEREAVKAGLSLNDALKVCAERGWQGFKADWYSEAPVNKQIALEERNRAVAMEWARSKA